MKKMLVGLALTTTLLVGVGPALAYDDGGDQGSGNDSRRCDRAENCRGSFSPGPFDRSPIEITGNTVCMPGATCYGDGKPPPPQKADGNGCLVFIPFHCDPHPKGQA
jgi:hypothetical protein